MSKAKDSLSNSYNHVWRQEPGSRDQVPTPHSSKLLLCPVRKSWTARRVRREDWALRELH